MQPTTTSTLDPASDLPWRMWLSLAVRLFLGVFFLIAGAEKLTALDQFAHAIYNYRMMPLELVNIVALLFVWTEITVGILLIAGAAVRGSALVTAAMLVVFIVALLSAMARGLEIDCGCFAPATEATTNAAGTADTTGQALGGAEIAVDTVGWGKVLEDVALLLLAAWLIYFPKSYLTIDRLMRKEGMRAEGGGMRESMKDEV